MAIVLLAGISISLSNILTPLVYETGGNPLALLLYRFLAFILICRLWLGLQQVETALPGRDRLLCYAVGIAYALGAGSLLGAIAFLPVSLAVLIFYTYPLLTFLFAALLARRVPTVLQAVCFAGAFLGLALALQVEGGSLAPAGLLLGALAAVSMAVAYSWSGHALAHIDSRVSTFHMAVCGALLAGLATLIAGDFGIPRGGATDWLLLIATIVTFAVAFLGMFTGVKRIGSARTAMLMNLEPVFTIALAFLVLAEGLSPTQLFGAGLVIVAVTLGQRQGTAEANGA